jgi:hypothetical protein
MADLDRFLKLERRRPERPPERHEETPSRFEGVGEEAATARQDGQASDRKASPFSTGDEPKLHFKEDDDGPSFVRCCHCKMDNSGAAPHCRSCGLSLRTPEQRVFNEALWRSKQEAQAEQQRERERLEELERRTRLERATEAMRLEAEAMRGHPFSTLGERGHGEGGWGHTRWGGPPALALLFHALPEPCRRPRVWLPVLAVLNLLALSLAVHLGIGYGAWTVLLILQAAVAFEIWCAAD